MAKIDCVYVWKFAHVHICVHVFEDVSKSHVTYELLPH